MASVTARRNTSEKQGRLTSGPVAASTKVYGGAFACRDTSGNIVDGAATAGLRFAGVVRSSIDNSAGAAGDLDADLFIDGVWFFAASGLTEDDVGKDVFLSDNQTVVLARNAAGIRVGKIKEVVSATEAGVDISPNARGQIAITGAVEGDVVADDNGNMIVGTVPFSGRLVDVILSVGTNGVDGSNPLSLAGVASVNGTALCSTDPLIDKTAGTGQKTTAYSGTGITQAVVKSDGTEDVGPGDVFKFNLDITRTASPGTEIADAVVAIVIEPN